MAKRMSFMAGKAFAERWKLVAEAEREELRSTSLKQKLAQLGALVEATRSLGWETTDQAEVEEVRARWRRLEVLYRAR